jgi:hypothetical protein
VAHAPERVFPQHFPDGRSNAGRPLRFVLAPDNPADPPVLHHARPMYCSLNLITAKYGLFTDHCEFLAQFSLLFSQIAVSTINYTRASC